ncbi:MAG TPA: amidohydrolase [Firmicutes bacterium]|nr:amidohydrolase [Bacillota bacterium]
MKYEIIDFHVHFPYGGIDLFSSFREDYKARFGKEKWEYIMDQNQIAQEKWWDRWGFGRPSNAEYSLEALAGKWFAELETNHISKVVFVTGGGNEALREVAQSYPDRFIGFAHHDPCAPDAVEQLEKAVVEWGLKGYKIIAPAVKRPLNDRTLDPLWAKAEELKIPVLIHFGVLGGGGGIAYHHNINPLIIHDVAKGFPYLTFVVPHFGCGYVRETLHLCWVCENVMIDTSGNNEWMRWMPEKWTLNDLFQRYYETIGPDRILFGSDSSWLPRGFVKRYLEEQLKAVGELGWNPEDIKKVFSENAKRILAINR